jgi:hypothetical protein
MFIKKTTLNYSFLTWKWKLLAKRREYYFYLLNVYLFFVWLAITYEVNKGRVLVRKNPTPISLVPFVFLIFHLVYSVCALLPKKYKKIITERPKMAYFTSLSLVIGSWILVFLHSHQLNDASKASLILVYVLTTEIGVTIFHHMGFANPIILLLKFTSLVLWIIFLSFTVSNLFPHLFVLFANVFLSS